MNEQRIIIGPDNHLYWIGDEMKLKDMPGDTRFWISLQNLSPGVRHYLFQHRCDRSRRHPLVRLPDTDPRVKAWLIGREAVAMTPKDRVKDIVGYRLPVLNEEYVTVCGVRVSNGGFWSQPQVVLGKPAPAVHTITIDQGTDQERSLEMSHKSYIAWQEALRD